MLTVDTTEFIGALKRLKIHLKARQHLQVLIRKGNEAGELILELHGRSKWSGLLTGVHAHGDWDMEVLVPASALRGLVRTPPARKTTKIRYEDGRLHLDAWSCPGKIA